MSPSRRRPNAPLLPPALLVALVALLSLCAGALAFAPAISISILPPRTAPFREHQPGPAAAAAVSPRGSRRYAAVAAGSWSSDDDDDDRDSAEVGDGPRHLQPVQHGDELILPRRSGRIPFSQRRGSSSSGGSGGGGGGGGGGNNGGTGGSSDGSSSSSRRRRGEGGGDPERGEGRPVFRGVRTSFNEMDEAGRFVRSPSAFRGWVGPEELRFKPQANRYHLYVSLSCPWSAACLMAMYLKGLDNAISVSVTHPVWQRTKPNDEMDSHFGWVFRSSKDPPLPSPSGFGGLFACDGCVPDYINGARSVRELYEMARPRDTNGKFTVPVLWDKRLGTIVNNESGDILRMLNTEFNAFAMNPRLDLYPADLADKLEELEGWLHDCVTDGVYRSGLARSQKAYDEAVDALYQGLDHAETMLSGQRYLLGERLTGPDIRLFHALVRYDEVYHTLFRCNRRSVLADFPNLLNYARDLYQLPGASLSVDMAHIRLHYYGSHPSLNPYGIVPTGPRFLNELYKPHDRDRFPRQSAGLW